MKVKSKTVPFSYSKDWSEPQCKKLQRIPKSPKKKASQVHWCHEKLKSRICFTLSAAFYPEHWAFNSPETFRCIFIVSQCCSTGGWFADMQVICLGAAWTLFLPFSSQTIADKHAGLGCWLSQLAESERYMKQQTQRGWLSPYSNTLAKPGATLQRVRRAAAPLNK